jgi:hypothetical protein
VARLAAPVRSLRISQHAVQQRSLNAAPVLPRAPSKRGSVQVLAAAAGAAAPAPFKWGADMKNLAISIGVGVALSLCPAPAGVTAKAWQLLSVFVGTIVGVITTPLPLGAVAMLGLGVAMLTKTLTFAEAFSAFANEIP